MKKSIIVIIAILSFGISESFGQQDVQFTQYFWNKLLMNSGYAGSHDVASFTLIHRDQWTGIVDNGRPVSSSFSFHTPLPNEKMGVGISVVRDVLGPTESTNISGDFAYRLTLTEDSRLAFGVKAGIDLFKAELMGLVGTSSDPSFAANMGGNTLPNFGASAYYWSNEAFLGISAPRLLENDFADGSTIQGLEKRHYYIMGGYVFDISPLVKFKPTFLGKIESNSPASIDATANFLFHEKLWVGAAYRSEDSWDANISYLFTDALRAGFAWDFTLSELKQVNNGSWEVMLGYDLNWNKEQVMSPRYF